MCFVPNVHVFGVISEKGKLGGLVLDCDGWMECNKSTAECPAIFVWMRRLCLGICVGDEWDACI